MFSKFLSFFLIVLFTFGCKSNKEVAETPPATLPFTWDNATIYFMMTDRFNNGDPSNDYQHTKENPPAPLRGYMGGDIKGITQKINQGYFSDLGVNAIWMTPLVEQIIGSVDEGTGNSFGFHGYWTRDWTALDPKFGTGADLKEMIDAAHGKGIRILLDVVANHTGPVTDKDSQWPSEWVKTGPRCTYQSAETTINCTLVDNLPDIKTESDKAVELPPFLIEKWKSEGRYDKEVEELNKWFAETGLQRTPVNYILKWVVDFIKDYGVDGFRVDTVKHTEDFVWVTLWKEASKAFNDWKKENPDKKLDDAPFYMVGEVYNYFAGNGRMFDYGDKKVDFFKDAFSSLINFDFKGDAKNGYEEIFTKYDNLLHGELKGKSIVNYISSHDDGGPFDLMRKQPFESGTKLLLCPGGAQIYYGDESARDLSIEEANGDAKLRSFMNWDELRAMKQKNGYTVNDVLIHWQKIGNFRNDHPAIGAGKHQMVSESPYLFTRSWTAPNGASDKVLIGLDLPKGQMTLDVSSLAKDGETVKDVYGGTTSTVQNGKVTIDSMFDIVLLEKV
ncbi:MAG: alpha-amylase family glycosyl hydrolase [Saprospiraceae bacterium]|nr:alpha-amylase family glycosyl hydrolase [Saprospiraceae bacterium]